jgi:hypothetical protein
MAAGTYIRRSICIMSVMVKLKLLLSKVEPRKSRLTRHTSVLSFHRRPDCRCTTIMESKCATFPIALRSCGVG